MSNYLRRISLRRLLLLCAATVALGTAGTAVALAVDTGPTPPAKPLASAIHAALTATAPSGVSARVELVDHLFEGSEIQSQAEGGGAGNPLLSGGAGRLWITAGHVRLELESESGATELLWSEGTLTLYQASSHTLYRYTPPTETGGGEARAADGEGKSIPTVAAIQEELARLMGHLAISGATPTDVAGQPAYAATVAPKRDSGLFGDAEVAWDASNGAPLRFAIYAKGNATPAIELTVTEVSFGAVPSSDFSLDLPSGLKETTIEPSEHQGTGHSAHGAGRPSVEATGLAAVQAAVPFQLQAPATLAGMQRHEVRLIGADGHSAALIGYGEGLGGIVVIETAASGKRHEAESSSGSAELPTKTIDGAKATELPTVLGTLLSFRSGGVEHVLAGSVTPSTIEAAARGL